MSNTIQATFGLDITPMQAAANRAIGVAKELSKQVGGALGAAAVASFGVAGLKALTGFASHIGDTADALNISTDAFQQYSFALSQSGGSQEAFEKGMRSLILKIEEAKDKGMDAVPAFEKLGITWRDLNTLSPDKIILKMADAIHGADDQGRAFAATADLLGKKVVTQWIPALRDGAAGFDAVAKSAAKANIETIRTLKEMDDAIDRLKTGSQAGLSNLVAHAVIGWQRIFDPKVAKEAAIKAQEAANEELYGLKIIPGDEVGPDPGKSMKAFEEAERYTAELVKEQETANRSHLEAAEIYREINRDAMTDQQLLVDLEAERVQLAADLADAMKDVSAAGKIQTAEMEKQLALHDRRIANLKRQHPSPGVELFQRANARQTEFLAAMTVLGPAVGMAAYAASQQRGGYHSPFDGHGSLITGHLRTGSLSSHVDSAQKHAAKTSTTLTDIFNLLKDVIGP